MDDGINERLDRLLQGCSNTAAVYKFVILWMGFNYAYNEDDASGQLCSDLERFIGKFSGGTEQAIINNESGKRRLLDTFRNIPYRDDTPRMCVENMRHHTHADLPDNFNATQLLTVIYTIRCNLFHGDKLEHLEQEQDLLLWAIDVLNLIRRAESV